MHIIEPLTLLVGTADLHINDTCALCPPVYRRELDAEHRPGHLIMQIWVAWKEFWQIIADKRTDLENQLIREIQKTRKVGKREAREEAQGLLRVVHIVDGDACDMNTHETTQLISTNRVDVQRALIDVFDPVMAVVDDTFIIRGTAAHTGPNGELEEWFAQDIGAIACPDDDCVSWWKLKNIFSGVRVFAAHHSPTGTKLDNKKNQSAARAAERVAVSYMRLGMSRRPNLVLFAHRHYPAFGDELGVRCRYLPSWKLVGAFGHRLAATNAEPIGGWWGVLRGGKIIEEPKDDEGLGPFELWRLPSVDKWHEL